MVSGIYKYIVFDTPPRSKKATASTDGRKYLVRQVSELLGEVLVLLALGFHVGVHRRDPLLVVQSSNSAFAAAIRSAT